MKSRYWASLAGICVLILASTAVLAQAGVAVIVGDVRAPHGESAEIPIELHNASGVGAMHIEMSYDSAVLAPIEEVEAGGLASGGLVVGNFSSPGRVIISVAHASGISGDGVVAKIVAHVAGQDGASTPLTLQNVTASNAQTTADIVAVVEDGSFTVASGSIGAGVWALIGLLAVVVFGAAAYAFTRRTTSRRANTTAAVGLGLQVTGGPASQTFLPLNQPVITIGRAATNHLVLDDEQVSREHARIVTSGNVHTINDLGSGNGTFVNGQRVAHHVLQVGDRITIGSATLLVRQG